MISAVDSSVILDVIVDDERFAQASEDILRRASSEGQLVVCECVLAEIRPAFGSAQAFDEFLADWQLEFSASTIESAKMAGAQFQMYLQRGGKQGRIVVDSLIGAHASLHADRLIARDRGYLRDYFSELVLLNPTNATPPAHPSA